VGELDDHVVWGRIVRFHIRDDLYLDRGRIDTSALTPVGRLAAEYTATDNVAWRRTFRRSPRKAGRPRAPLSRRRRDEPDRGLADVVQLRPHPAGVAHDHALL
jgi:hypothetical protein